MSIAKPKYHINNFFCNHIKDMTISFFFGVFLRAKDHNFMPRQQFT